MAAHRAPRWTPAEIAILREHYPSGGLKAALPMLPGRSWHAIHMQAQKLRIGCDMTKVCGGGRRCKCEGSDLEQALQWRAEGWSMAKIGAHLGLAESTINNAVLIHQCMAGGYTPAERYPNGRLTPAARERLRWMLKKGLRGVEIQLRLGISAAAVHNERVRYNADLEGRGKAPCPPAGNGESYSGARIPAERRKLAERLFLEGFGTQKVSEQSGVSKTVCTRIRARLVKRLRAKGKALPGCGLDGRRHVMRDHARAVPDALKAKFRALIMQRVPVRRAALIAGIGSCTGYKLRDAMKAEGMDVPRPRLPGKTQPLQREMMNAGAIPQGKLYRYRRLVRELGDPDKARAALRAEIAEAKRNLTFEERLKLVAQGHGKVVAVQRIATAGPDFTLGGVVGAIL